MNTQEQTPAVYTGCERAAEAILFPSIDYSGRTARIKDIIAERTAAPAMYAALETITMLCNEDFDERDPFANIKSLAEAALAAARKGGAL